MDQSSVTSGAETLKKREREQEDDEEEIDEVEQKKLDDAFLDACKNGTLDDVKRTLRAGAFIIAQNRNGNTGLNLVVRREEQEIVFEIVKFLLSKRCHPSITNEEGENAVHLAADFASADVMKLLLAKDRHLAALSDRSGWTPLGSVCFDSERVAEEAVEIARLLLDAGADIEQGSIDRTPLLLACENGHPELVSFLLQRGANANAADEDGRTCLHWACRNGAFGREMIPALVKAEANVAEETYDGDNALDLALQSGYAMAEALLPYLPQGSKPTSVAESKNDPIGCMKMLVQLGLEVDDFSRGWRSTVHWARLRNGRRLHFDGSARDVFNQLSKSRDDDLWIWASREPCFQQHPTTGDTVLHLLARTDKLSSDQKMKVFAALKEDFRNPLIPNFQNERAIDLTSDPVLKAELAKYMEWQPNRWAMHWFGPLFRKRAFALLLVLKRYPRAYVKDIRHLLVKYVARAEHIYVPSKV